MTSKQEVQNRRLLEEIQQQKRQLMLKSSRPPTASLRYARPQYSRIPQAKAPAPDVKASQSEMSEIQQWSTFASTTLQGAPITHPQGPAMLRAAEAQCFAYFVTSNSNYGNMLIPAIPRIEPSATPTTSQPAQPQNTP